MKFFNWTSIALALFSVGLVGCGGSGGGGTNPTIDGVDGPYVEYTAGKVYFSMILKNVEAVGGAMIPIPKYPNSVLQIGPDFNSAGTLLMLTIDASDWLANKGNGFDPQKLPGGRDLPGVIGGQMPAFALVLPDFHNAVFYVGPEVIGFFMPFGHFDTSGAIISFRFYNKKNEPVGTLSLVGEDSDGKNCGLLALMNVDLLGIINGTDKKTLLQKFARMGF
jgi:hypothetical protein